MAAIGIVSLVLGIPGTIDACNHQISSFVNMIQQYAQTDDDAAILKRELEARRKSLQAIFVLVSTIGSKLGSEFEREIQDELSNLHLLLYKGWQRGMDVGLFETSHGKSLKLLISGKRVISNLLDECEKWETIIHRRLNVIWMTKSIDFISQETRNTMPRLGKFNDVRGHDTRINVQWDLSNISPGPLPSSWIYYQNSTDTSSDNLVEFREYDKDILLDSTKFEEIENAVAEVGRLLQTADARLMSVLQCIAYWHDKKLNRFPFVYAIPTGLTHPNTLRELLTSKLNRTSKRTLVEIFNQSVTEHVTPSFEQVLRIARQEEHIRFPLNHRLRLATKLAASLSYIHSAQFVHKHLNPENIVVFSAKNDQTFPYVLGYPFLLGFDRTRTQHAWSSGYGETDMADCIYHHPDRWGRVTGIRFSMLHDAYSLGVVLLEVGLWKSLVFWVPPEIGISQQRYISWGRIRKMFDENTGQLKPNFSPTHVQNELINFAKRELPPIMGEGYTQVVLACLSGSFDKENIQANEVFDDGGVGVLYMKHVVSKLEKLVLD